MFYPVEYDPKLRIFNNQIDFYEFLAEANPEINVGLSALLPPTEFVVGEKHFPCRTIVDFFEQIAEQTGLPIDTKASTIRMGVILLFFTENLDESVLTLQSGDAHITLTPSVFKEVDAAFKVSVAEGYLWDPAGMPEKVAINDEQCNIVYAEDTQTFTIGWPKKRSQAVNLGLTSTAAPEPEPEPEPGEAYAVLLKAEDPNIIITPNRLEAGDTFLVTISAAEGYEISSNTIPGNISQDYPDATARLTIVSGEEGATLFSVTYFGYGAANVSGNSEYVFTSDVISTAPVALQDAESAIMTMSMEEATPDSVDAILQQAAALEDEADKSGSKVALEAFAKQHGVSLARNKTFANMMKDFEAALRA